MGSCLKVNVNVCRMSAPMELEAPASAPPRQQESLSNLREGLGHACGLLKLVAERVDLIDVFRLPEPEDQGAAQNLRNILSVVKNFQDQPLALVIKNTVTTIQENTNVLSPEQKGILESAFKINPSLADMVNLIRILRKVSDEIVGLSRGLLSAEVAGLPGASLLSMLPRSLPPLAPLPQQLL